MPCHTSLDRLEGQTRPPAGLKQYLPVPSIRPIRPIRPPRRPSIRPSRSHWRALRWRASCRLIDEDLHFIQERCVALRWLQMLQLDEDICSATCWRVSAITCCNIIIQRSAMVALSGWAAHSDQPEAPRTCAVQNAMLHHAACSATPRQPGAP